MNEDWLNNHYLKFFEETGEEDVVSKHYNEGWHNKDYLILFPDEEIEGISNKYCIDQYLPGYIVLGLWDWDEFIVRDKWGYTYIVPTVPMDRQFLKRVQLPKPLKLQADTNVGGKIRWIAKPLFFGGDPNKRGNLSWVTHEQHQQLVVWWNKQYHSLNSESD